MSASMARLPPPATAWRSVTSRPWMSTPTKRPKSCFLTSHKGEESMNALQGLLALIGRILLCAIFIMATVGNKIPHFRGVADVMGSVGIPAPEIMLVGAIAFLLVGSALVILGCHARLGAFLL